MGAVNWFYVFTIILPVVLVVWLTITFIVMTIYDLCYWVYRIIDKWVWERRLHN